MENISLLASGNKDNQINTIESNQPKGLPHFIVIQKINNKKIRIPCVNEKVAERVLSGFNKLSNKS